MKINYTFFLFLILLFGCGRNIPKDLFNQIQNPESGFIYLNTSETLNDELTVLKSSMDSRDLTNQKNALNEYIAALDTIMINRNENSFKINSFCLARPIPNPCPDPINRLKFKYSRLAFFSRECDQPIEITINNQSPILLNKGVYLEATKTRIVPFSTKKLKFKEGDILKIKVPIEYLNKNNKKISRDFIYEKEIIF